MILKDDLIEISLQVYVKEERTSVEVFYKVQKFIEEIVIWRFLLSERDVNNKKVFYADIGPEFYFESRTESP